jgi:hypothetical protein
MLESSIKRTNAYWVFRDSWEDAWVVFTWAGATLGAGSFTASGSFAVSAGTVERSCRESGAGTGEATATATATGSGEATATGSGEATATGEATTGLRKNGRQGRQKARARGTHATWGTRGRSCERDASEGGAEDVREETTGTADESADSATEITAVARSSTEIVATPDKSEITLTGVSVDKREKQTQDIYLYYIYLSLDQSVWIYT